jgi:hypothetical protein
MNHGNSMPSLASLPAVPVPRLLRLDEQGGLRLNLSVSDFLPGGAPGRQAGAAGDDRWAVEYLEVEVTGRAEGD